LRRIQGSWRPQLSTACSMLQWFPIRLSWTVLKLSHLELRPFRLIIPMARVLKINCLLKSAQYSSTFKANKRSSSHPGLRLSCAPISHCIADLFIQVKSLIRQIESRKPNRRGHSSLTAANHFAPGIPA
jgi:hypothetical protein